MMWCKCICFHWHFWWLVTLMVNNDTLQIQCRAVLPLSFLLTCLFQCLNPSSVFSIPASAIRSATCFSRSLMRSPISSILSVILSVRAWKFSCSWCSRFSASWERHSAPSGSPAAIATADRWGRRALHGQVAMRRGRPPSLARHQLERALLRKRRGLWMEAARFPSGGCRAEGRQHGRSWRGRTSCGKNRGSLAAFFLPSCWRHCCDVRAGWLFFPAGCQALYFLLLPSF